MASPKIINNTLRRLSGMYPHAKQTAESVAEWHSKLDDVPNWVLIDATGYMPDFYPTWHPTIGQFLEAARKLYGMVPKYSVPDSEYKSDE